MRPNPVLHCLLNHCHNMDIKKKMDFNGMFLHVDIQDGYKMSSKKTFSDNGMNTAT